MEHLGHGVGDAGALQAALLWLEGSALGAAARRSLWLYPLASVSHVLGVALLLGAAAGFDLRVLGVARAVPVRAAARLLLPIAALGVALQLASGLVLFSADASHVAPNPFFVAKLAVVGVALLNVLAFHRLAGPGLGRLGEGEAPGWAKAGAALSLAAWPVAAACGRLIAYA